MADCKYQFIHKHCLSVCLLLCLASLCGVSVQAEESDRHVCKDRQREFFSFIPPDGWSAMNRDDYSYKAGKRVDRHIKSFGSPNSGPLEAVCYENGQRPVEHPLIFVFRAYNLNGTGNELETKWMSERYQKRKSKQLVSLKDLSIPHNDRLEIFRSNYNYRQDVHAAYEKIEGIIDGDKFVRIKVTMLGAVNHATIFCQFEGIHADKAVGLVDQIINTFQFPPDNVFAGPLEENVEQNPILDRKLQTAGVLLILFGPMAIGAVLGIWLSATHYGIKHSFLISLPAAVVLTVIFVLMMRFGFLVSILLSAAAVFALLAAIIREEYDNLAKITGYGLLGAVLGLAVVYFYFAFRISMAVG